MESETLHSEPIYSGKVIRVTRDRLRVPSGNEVIRDVVHHAGAVVMVPVTSSGELLFVRQYRYAARQRLLELPAGTLEPLENPVDCVQRELQEEVGFRAGRVRKIGEFFTAPGFCTELLHLFVAEDLTPSQLPADDDEDLEVVSMPVDAAVRLACQGELRDAKTLAGVLLYAAAAGR